LINERVVQYKQKYADKDNQDFLAMAALQFVIKNIESEELLDDKPLLDEIEALNKELETYLSKV
jgi:cell division protein ZapA